MVFETWTRLLASASQSTLAALHHKTYDTIVTYFFYADLPELYFFRHATVRPRLRSHRGRTATRVP